MALRGYGFQSITATTPIPVFGTTLTALIRVTPGNSGSSALFSPGSNPSYVVAPVANPYFFRVGDKVNVGASTAFGLTATTLCDTGKVVLVDYAGSKITIQGLAQATHASGEYVVLSVDCSGFNITAGNNSAILNLGEDPTVSATSNTLIAQLFATASYSFGPSTVESVFGTSHIWIEGTHTGDTYLPSVMLI